MKILLSILLFTFVTDDEKTNLQPVRVADLEYQIKSFISEHNLSAADSTRIMEVLSFGDFVGNDIYGEKINYSNPDAPHYRDADAVLFGYYAEWCPNCHRNLPSAIRLYQKYNKRGLAVVLSFMYSDPDRIYSYVQDENIPFPVLIGSEDREENPEVRLETTHYILRTILDDYRRWGTPFYILYIKDEPDTWYVVAGEFIEEEIDTFLYDRLSTR